MIKKRNITTIFLMLAALFTVVCTCNVGMFGPVPYKLVDHQCRYSGDVYSDSSTKFDGTFTCRNPDGTLLTCPYTGQQVASADIRVRPYDPPILTDEQFWARFGCVDTGESAPTATVVPTATATSTAIPTLAATPLLSGDVTACDRKAGFINFELAAISPLVSESDVVLTINGRQVPCQFAGNDNSLLSCPLPADVTFPAQIHVAVAGSNTDDFSYDGSGCAVPGGPSGGGGGEGNPPTANPGGD